MARVKKGVAGKRTGGAARKAIRAAIKKGCTIIQIARSARRSTSTISAILNGEIKNPPENVSSMINKGCKKKR